MQIRHFAWFDSKHEKTEFINLLRSCGSELEAVYKILNKYPDLKLNEVKGLLENEYFKKEINKGTNHET